MGAGQQRTHCAAATGAWLVWSHNLLPRLPSPPRQEVPPLLARARAPACLTAWPSKEAPGWVE